MFVFKPLAAIACAVLCALSSPVSGALDDIGHAPPSVHRLRFIVDPALLRDMDGAQAARRLATYVADINAVFSRETVRRFAFDPDTDLRVMAPAAAPECGLGNLVDGEISLCVSKSLRGYSHGGLSMSWTYPQKGVVWNLNWLAIHDPQRLSRAITSDAPESTEKDYLGRQLKTLLHELEHAFGAGSGEYYNASLVRDTTGVAPRTDLDLADPKDRYWWPRQHWRFDPLLGSAFEEAEDPQASRAATLARTRFTAGTKAMIDTDWRQWPRWAQASYMPQTAGTRVAVMDRETGEPLARAQVAVWRDPGARKPLELLASGTTDRHGRFVFDWHCGFSCFAVGKTNLLVKAQAEGRTPGATWFTIFDAFEQKAVQGRSDFTIELPLGAPDAAPPRVSLAAPAMAVVGEPTTIAPVAVDDFGIAGIKVMAAGSSLPICSFTAAPFACSWTPLRPGMQTIEVLAIDTAGNTASASAHVIVQPARERVAASR